MAAPATPFFQTAAWLALLAASMGAGPRAAAAAVAGTWQRVPLGSVAQALPPLVGRPVVLDSRVDPTTPITLTADGLSPADMLERLGKGSGSEVVVLRESVRLAPAGRRAALQAAEEIRAAELQAAEPRWQKALARRQAGGWAAAATPRDVITHLVESAGGTLRGLELVPHDHLRGLELPAMSRAAQLDLLLASYDLRAAIRPAGVEVVRLDPQARPQRPPQLNPPPPQPRDAMAAAGESVFTLEAAAPLQQLLAAICNQTGLTLRLDAASLQTAGITADRIVRVNVREASRDELFDAIAKPLGLHWRIDVDVLVVTAATTPSAAGPASGEPLQD